MAGEMFVDRVVQHLENAVVQPAFIRGPNVHSRPLPDAARPSSLSIFEASYLVLVSLVQVGMFARGGETILGVLVGHKWVRKNRV